MAMEGQEDFAELVLVSKQEGDLHVGPEQIVVRDGRRVLLGRLDFNDVQVNHRKISGKHLELRWASGRVELQVLGSLGCWLNDVYMDKGTKFCMDHSEKITLATKPKDIKSVKELKDHVEICSFQLRVHSRQSPREDSERVSGPAAINAATPKCKVRPAPPPTAALAVALVAPVAAAPAAALAAAPGEEEMESPRTLDEQKRFVAEEMQRTEEQLRQVEREELESKNMASLALSVPEPLVTPMCPANEPMPGDGGEAPRTVPATSPGATASTTPGGLDAAKAASKPAEPSGRLPCGRDERTRPPKAVDDRCGQALDPPSCGRWIEGVLVWLKRRVHESRRIENMRLQH
ncbi:unnamed protein product [Durusdinium trenchii]|uniref:FHA domain-containing protein n=1 Tax=Durusdinium trenchii TaxID=1381693 RepID=A0ABP0NIH4_9DINO